VKQIPTANPVEAGSSDTVNRPVGDREGGAGTPAIVHYKSLAIACPT